MKKIGKSLTSIILVIGILLTMSFGITASAATSTVTFNNFFTESFDTINATEAAKWVNLAPTPVSITGGQIKGNDWGQPSFMTYNALNLNETYKFGVDVLNNFGGAAGNWGGVLFNFQSDFKGYCVEVQGGDTGTIVLKKYTGNMWNGIQTIATYPDTTYLKKANVRIEVTYEVGGYISVDCIKAGVTTRIFDRILDTTYTSGNIGVAKQASGFVYDNVAVARPVVEEGTVVSYSAIDSANARYLGRVYTMSSSAEMHYPLCGIEFMVKDAAKVAIELKFGGDVTIQTSVGVYIDDSLTYNEYVIPGTVYSYLTVANFTQPGTHKIRVVKLNGQNTYINMKNIKAYGLGDAVPTVFASSPKSRKIEFVGDSITVGAGITSSIEESGKSYATITANYFGADVSMPAVSGGGFLRDINDSNNFGMNAYNFYGKVYGWTKDSIFNWDFTKFTPDIIVVNLGTNGGIDNTPDHYIQFFSQVRASYNDTVTKKIPIIATLGPISLAAWDDLSVAVTQLNAAGDNNIYLFSLGDGKYNGYSGHPNEVEQRQTAEMLIPKIKEILPEWGNAMLTTNTVNATTNKVTVFFNALKQTSVNESYILLGAVSDENGKLIGIGRKNISFGSNAQSVTDALEITSTDLSVAKNYKLKLFLWDSNMQPIALPAEANIFSPIN